ncbi:MAG: GPR endopeptidase [Oscillospiraceae bacterium]
MLSRRTDLALEARKIWSEDNSRELPGVTEERRLVKGFPVTAVKIDSQLAAEELCKPIGTYLTVELGRFMRREDDAFADGAEAIANALNEVISDLHGTALIVGLGNPAITPDAVGHIVIKNTLITRHLHRELPEQFTGFGDVCALEPGVLGTTGIESVDTVGAVVRELSPSYVIAVDALASRSMDRVCRTVQVCDTGIIPGSGVGSARKALSQETLGVPVIAIGVPTVVDAATLALDMAHDAGVELDPDSLRRHQGAMIVTPKEIDSNVNDISRLIAYGLNLALHKGLTVQDVDMMLG